MKYFFYSKFTIDENLQKELTDLGIEILREFPSSEMTYLSYELDEFILHMGPSIKFKIDFKELKYRRKFAPKTELLCRACGWHLGMRKIIDLTAGLAVDSIMLAQAGFNVLSFEENPYLFVLLNQAHKNLNNLNLNFKWGDSVHLLKNISELPEVIYFDPMYPHKKKTALPSKEIQILREICNLDGKPEVVAQIAFECKVKRLVIKRPLKADPLLPKPTFQIEGKLVRFDVYSSSK